MTEDLNSCSLRRSNHKLILSDYQALDVRELYEKSKALVCSLGSASTS